MMKQGALPELHEKGVLLATQAAVGGSVTVLPAQVMTLSPVELEAVSLRVMHVLLHNGLGRCGAVSSIGINVGKLCNDGSHSSHRYHSLSSILSPTANH
jgi:hypothetical protein